MSNTAKVSISVAEPELLSWAKQRAERTGVSLSSVFTEAVRLERQIEARGRVIEWIGSEAKPTPGEASAIVAEWGGLPGGASRPRKPPSSKRSRAKR
jgi:hypothetical protein